MRFLPWITKVLRGSSIMLEVCVCVCALELAYRPGRVLSHGVVYFIYVLFQGVP
jgi:hypothetical protein